MDRAMRRQATIGEAHEPEPASWLACAGGLLVLLIGVWLYGRVAVLVIAAVDQMFVAVGVAPDVVALGHDQAEWTLSLELRLLSLLSLGRAAAAAVAPRVARSYREYCRRYFGAGGSIPVRCAVGFWVY